MKKVILSLMLVGGFWAYSTAQSATGTENTTKPGLAVQHKSSQDAYVVAASDTTKKEKATTTKSCCHPKTTDPNCGGHKSSSPSCCQKTSPAKKD